MPDNRELTPPDGPDPTDEGVGSGIMVGDGVMLTAGHVMFEANEEDDPTNRGIITLRGAGVYWDPRGYQSAFAAIYAGLSNPLPNTSNSLSREVIEPQLTQKDLIFVTQSGKVDDSDAGLILYLDRGDIALKNFSLTSGARYRRWGATTGRRTVDWQQLSVGGVGVQWTGSSDQLQGGDSGGGNWIDFEGREFIVGNNVSINGAGISFASYITSNEFYGLNTMLEEQKDIGGDNVQSGDVTEAEPTNLIVGSSSDDSNADGTYRSDIILGKGGNDTITDGDETFDQVWANDYLYGGGGNDKFIAGNGDDLIHGGDHRLYGDDDERTWSIAEDGEDSVDYAGLQERNADGEALGLELRIGTKTSSPEPVWVYGENETDRQLASYIIDRHTDALISIEKIALTNSDDVLTINVTCSPEM